MPRTRQDSLKRQTRIASIVMLLSVLLWFGMNWLASTYGWSVRTALLGDLACLAALGWSLFVFVNVRRARREEGN